MEGYIDRLIGAESYLLRHAGIVSIRKVNKKDVKDDD
jgi:hypothetical protein